MKNLILLLILISNTLYAQPDNCKFLENKTDEFTNQRIITSDLQGLLERIDGDPLTASVNYSDGRYAIILVGGAYQGSYCLSPNSSYLYLKLANDSILKLDYIGNTKCDDPPTGIYRLTEGDIKALLSYDVIKIRIQGTEKHFDYSLENYIQKAFFGMGKINPQQYFRNALECVSFVVEDEFN